MRINKFTAYPITSWFEFRKQVLNVDPNIQRELENFSNDPEYANKLWKEKKMGTASRIIDDMSSKARTQTGMEETEETTKLSSIKSSMQKKKEKMNKEDADFDELELYPNNDDGDIALAGQDYIPDDESEESLPNIDVSNRLKLLKKDTNLNEDGAEMLKVI
jgi:hypothetical protein